MAKKVTLTWTKPAATNFDHYEVWRNIDAGAYAQVGSDISDVNIETYVDDNAGAGLADNTYHYQVRTYNSAGEYESVGILIVEAVVADTILFEDDFAGTTIDETTNWNKTIADAAECDLVQDGDLLLDIKAQVEGAVCDTNLTGKNAYPISPLLVCSFDITNVNQNQFNAFFSIGITKDSNASANIDRIAIQRSTTVGAISLLTRESGGNVDTQNEALDISTIKTIKIVVDTTNVKFYYWNGSAWTQLGTTYAHASTGSFYPVIGSNCNNFSTIVDTNIDNYVLTDTDFATQRP